MPPAHYFNLTSYYTHAYIYIFRRGEKSMNWSWAGFLHFDLRLNSNKEWSTFVCSEKLLGNIINSGFGRTVCISLSEAVYICLDYQHFTGDKNKAL